MSIIGFKFNAIKKKPVYYYSKIAKRGKILKIKLDNGVQYYFRARTLDRAVLKEIWTNDSYYRKGFEIGETDTVIDIGGHIGVFSVYAAHYAKKGHVFAIEPFPDNYELLVSNIKLNGLKNTTPKNVAIGKEDGSSRLFVRPQKLKKGEVAYNSGGHSFHLIKDSDSHIDVPTMSFNSLVDQLDLKKIDFLKLDCEGAEFDIMYAASEASLAKVSKIIMECHPFENNTKDEMVAFLEKHGFTCTAVKGDKYELYMIYAIRLEESDE
jgi:FkbM family methyltransferase